MEYEKRKNSDARTILGIPCGLSCGVMVVGFLILVMGACALITNSAVGIYNGGVSRQENAVGKWADVGTVEQRRMNLYDAIVPAVRAFAGQELAFVDRLAAQSAILRRFTEEPPMTAADRAAFTEAVAAYDAAAVEVATYVADNPELASDALFQDFMIQAEGAENRISTERARYNALVTELRTYCRTFPNVLVCSVTNLGNLYYFEAEEGAGDVEVDFGQ